MCKDRPALKLYRPIRNQGAFGNRDAKGGGKCVLDNDQARQPG